MKIQISSTKTVEWDPASLFKRQAGASVREVTGVEIGTRDPRGCPAVRLVRAGNGYRLKAFGFVPAPELGKTWSLPSEFRAPSAAITVNGEGAFSRLAAEESDEKVEAGAKVVDGVRTATLPVGGGTRLSVGLREETAAAVARLLPEGVRPTAVSIQVAQMSVLAALPAMSGFDAAAEAQLALVVGEEQVRVIGFRKGAPTLLRVCTDALGSRELRRSVCASLGLDEQTCDEMLEAGVVSPGPDFAEKVRPILRQLDIAREYLQRGASGGKIASVRVFGLKSGVAHWSALSRETCGLELTTASVFDGIKADGRLAGRLKDLTPGDAQIFLAALGAAIAALEAPSAAHPFHVNLLFANERVASSPIRKRVIFPIVGGILLAAMLGWWAILAATYALVAAERDEARGGRDALRTAYDAAMADRTKVAELKGHIAETRAFLAARHAYGGFLAHLAEMVPDDLQLRSLVLAPPRTAPIPVPGQALAPRQAAAAEEPTLRMTGLVPRENTLVGFMQDLAERDPTQELVSDAAAADAAKRSPRVHAFNQTDVEPEIGGAPVFARRRGPARRLLSFDVEFRMKERRFVK